MTILASDFRKNIRVYLDLIAKGEQVTIARYDQRFSIKLVEGK